MAGDFSDTDPQRLTQMSALNIATLTDVTRLLLPQLLGSSRTDQVEKRRHATRSTLRTPDGHRDQVPAKALSPQD